MRHIINILVIFVAMFVAFYGIYIGVWEMLIGGIVNIIDGAKMNPTNAGMITKGIAKVIFFKIPCVVGIVIGIFIAKSGIKV